MSTQPTAGIDQPEKPETQADPSAPPLGIDHPSRSDGFVRGLSEAIGGPLFLVLDEVDHLGSMVGPARDALLDQLPDDARIALAGRAEPEASWRADGLPASSSI